jgi:alpha-tubulin suppressor-like RCC1 family protein
MSKMNGVDFSSITALSGKSLVDAGGGIDAVPATTDSGIVVCPSNVGLKYPYSEAEFSDYSNPVHMYQLSSLTGVAELGSGAFSWGALLSNGDLYTGGGSNSNQLGISSGASDLVNNGGLGLSLSGVSKVAFGSQCIFAIKTDGTLWWAGSVSSYLNSTGTGQGTTNSSNGWTQIGSDTDWYDIKVYPSYPYQAIAIKGSSGSRYLYACGYNTNYGTGQGTTSGSTYSWTRVKSAASTDLSESISKIAISYSSCLAVTDGGKLFSWGENGYGNLGSGGTTDKPYATQVGSDTDWTNCWVQRFGGFALKSDGTMYMSTSRSSWRIEPSTNSTFTQIGTDTNYQDMALFSNYSSSMNYAVFAKKGGSWYVSSNQILGGSWPGSSYWSGSSEGTWTAINDALTENDITGTIDVVYPFYSSSNSNLPQLMFALS